MTKNYPGALTVPEGILDYAISAGDSISCMCLDCFGFSPSRRNPMGNATKVSVMYLKGLPTDKRELTVARIENLKLFLVKF